MRREYWKKGDDGMEADRGDEDGTTVGVSTAVGEGRLWKNRSWGSGGPEEQALRRELPVSSLPTPTGCKMPEILRRPGCGCPEGAGGRDSALAERTEPRWGRMARLLPRSPPARSRTSCTASAEGSGPSRRVAVVRVCSLSPKVIPAAAAAIPPPPRPTPNPGSRLAGPRPSAFSLSSVTLRRKCRAAERAVRLPFRGGLYSVAEGHVTSKAQL